jgi:hypothetical protein
MYSIGNPRNQVGNRGGIQPIGNPGRNNVLASMVFGGLPPPDPRAPPGSRNALAQALGQQQAPNALSVNPVQLGQPDAPQSMPQPTPQPGPPPPIPYDPSGIKALGAPDYSPVQHPLQMLARALNPIAANYQQGQNLLAERAQKDAQQTALADAMRAMQGGDMKAALGIRNLSPEAQQAILAQALKPPPVKDDYTIGDTRYSGKTNQPLATNTAADKPQPGYMFGPPGTGQTFIPGGSADPATIAAQDAARNPFILQQVYNPATNSMDTVAVPRQQVEQSIQQAQGGQAVVGSKPVQPTQDQTNAAGFADRLTSANAVLGQFEQQGGDALAQFLGGAPGGNYLVSPEWQQFDQARRDFVNAVLRRESGAAIGQQEFDNAARQYFPVPGDSPQVIAQKRQARDAALMNMTRAAGPGYQPAQTPATRPRGANDIDFNTLPPELQQQILQQRGGGR